MIFCEAQWRDSTKNHLARLEEFVEAHRARRSRNEKHPVHDFLFEYYGFRASLLLKWSPGIGVFCEDFSGFKELSFSPDGAFLDVAQFPLHRKAGLLEVLEILENTAQRPAFHGCNGLHEWAIVYRETAVRHQTPLRLSANEIAAFVESQPIRCSHYDAFRFFTPAARSFNLLNPQAETRAQFEQPGCIHANMDLYKWAAKFYPWIGSDLVADAFELAREARELDMRAAPYDLRAFGLEPIRLETPEGRREYSELQREIACQAIPVRENLIAAYRGLLNAVEQVSTREVTAGQM
ncbi:hypothetical protein B1R32_101100 [Abditibacterium utsteinense]|uniref:3-methyladenine DNA glycosylase n=1 Tax=Abditibacterium utsteinense TaxID=1960156 RepID=A0A2S8SX28_9BACT|nr:3-methyladenine DNA glycosylase [Abditibacterium utsteinense]PQV65360.1 hypothetical protein B1R32_101100 [Abditibacterium utsteinense]